MAYLNNELSKIQSFIDKIKNSEDYQIITKVAKQQVDSLLDNKKVILSLAIVSVVEALKNDPNRYFWVVAGNRILFPLLIIIITIHC